MKEVEKRSLLEWQQFVEDIRKETPPERLSTVEKARKKAYLEKHPVEWMQYFFPNYAACPFAPFQKEAINRICRNDEWFEVWSWARELAKSTVSMMLELYLMLTGRKHYLLMVSATQDAAVRLLAPYRANLEANGRLIDFYGEQQSIGKWEETNFVTKTNLTFLAVGYGNAPRGTRNEDVRPDIIDIDDYDTDKDCRNPVILDKKTEFIERAVQGLGVTRTRQTPGTYRASRDTRIHVLKSLEKGFENIRVRRGPKRCGSKETSGKI